MRRSYDIQHLNPEENAQYDSQRIFHFGNGGNIMSELYFALVEELNRTNQRISVCKKDLELLNLGEDSDEKERYREYLRDELCKAESDARMLNHALSPFF